MGKRFSGKVVLVTGGSSGIGRATAAAFAREGAQVVVSGRDSEKLRQTVKEIEAEGGAADAVAADVGVGAEVERLVTETVRRHGKLDIAFNNAGVLGTPAPTADLDEDGFDAVIRTNLTGTWLSMKHEIARMRASGGGVIVNMASNIGSHNRLPGMAAYAASKAAVSVLTRTAARDHIAEGIRINAVSPGATDTGMSFRPGETEADRAERLAAVIPLGRIGTVDEIAAAVLWLASDESAYVVGHDIVLDGGVTA
ncbi:glucose 1-dehydrogenase [Amycolatopsis regifaucium]|uniref:Short-chain dehydrogenase n=1 Tax=Amycolatopsis regifaucium TaxID=546365 RepID=A0A154M4K9_9PSEU|nr:glucose 1-dehydrogenase [Amycolatopsis regifaucium]KZB79561.1 short-chain dehydrogenase [Amycolatopsis regifaucium]OKA07846.1 short-chain dehydrogenase [Amycolatopsis regifaucium]